MKQKNLDLSPEETAKINWSLAHPPKMKEHNFKIVRTIKKVLKYKNLLIINY